MDELERLYRRLVQNIRAGFPELLTRSFEVSQLYQQIVPYRTNRRELEFDSNEDYELALMQLLAGLRGYVSADAEMQKAMRQELASPNPDLGAFRVYATAMVSLAPEPLRAIERIQVVSEAPRAAAASLSPGAQAVLAGRATEAVDVSGDRPAAPSSPAPASPAPASPAPASPAPASPAPASAAPASAAPASAAPASPAPVPAPPKPPTVPSFAAPAKPAPPPLEPVAPPTGTQVAPPRPAASPALAGSACRYCGGGLPEGRRVTFCPSCGHNLTVQHCPACATELEVGWKFCITCGRGVGQ